MKPFLMTAIVALIAAVSLNAQSPITDSYYEMKDALVNSNTVAAAENARKFINAINRFEIPDTAAGKSHALTHTLDKLRADGETIASTTNISKQREGFASLSATLFSLLKTIKLSTEPIYQQYCPMKKACWFSNDPTIRNPYYGQAMLTCGNITDTIKP